MHAKLFRSIWSIVSRSPISAATMRVMPKVIGSMRGCWLGSRWSTQISSTVWCCPPPPLLPVSVPANSWITSPPRSPPPRERLQAIDRFVWPGLEEQVFADPFAPATRFFREHCYDPRQVVQAGANTSRQQWDVSGLDGDDGGAWVERLLTLAQQVLTLYGTDGQFVDFEQLQAEVQRDQAWLNWLEQQHRTLRIHTVRPLYRAVHPSRNLETLKRVGQDSAAVYASVIGDPRRFRSTRLFRGWTGMVPDSQQSAENEAKGLHITQAGPDLIKKFAYLDAEIARRYDPQIAAIYYDQMMRKGKHHKQAVCACATHLLDRVLAVLRSDKPYEMRDTDGTALSGQQARELIVQRYSVPAEVRRRTNKRNRRQQADQRAERRARREHGRQPLLDGQLS